MATFVTSYSLKKFWEQVTAKAIKLIYFIQRSKLNVSKNFSFICLKYFYFIIYSYFLCCNVESTIIYNFRYYFHASFLFLFFFCLIVLFDRFALLALLFKLCQDLYTRKRKRKKLQGLNLMYLQAINWSIPLNFIGCFHLLVLIINNNFLGETNRTWTWSSGQNQQLDIWWLTFGWFEIIGANHFYYID